MANVRIRGGARGWSRMSGCESLRCACAHSPHNVTNKVPQKIFLQSFQEEFYEFFCDLNDDDYGTKYY